MRLYLATEQAKHTTAAGRRVGLLHGWACTSALSGCMERVGGWGAACLAYGSYLSSYRFGSGQALRGTPNPNRCLGWCWECFGLELGLDALGTHMWCTCVSLIAAQARLFRSHAADEPLANPSAPSRLRGCDCVLPSRAMPGMLVGAAPAPRRIASARA